MPTRLIDSDTGNSPSIAAVVASQYPLFARTAIRFNDTLYRSLAAGATVDVAVQDARSRLHGRLSVSSALFLRQPGPVRVVAAGHDVPSSRGSRANPSVFVGGV